MKVLLTSADLSNSIASVLRTAYPAAELLVVRREEIEPVDQDAEWLLARYDDDADGIVVRRLISQIRNLALDIPVILLQSEASSDRLVEGLRIGAADVVVLGDDRHLLQVIARVRNGRELRHQRDFWKRRHGLSERRCERLMDSSRDAIALIAEGSHVYVNETYADMLGYSSTDDLLLSPVSDVVAPECREEIKPLLRPLSATEPMAADRRMIRFLRADRGQVNLDVQIHQIDYQDEPTLQWIIHDTAVGTPRGLAAAEAPSQGAANPEVIEAQQVNLRRMVEHVAKAMKATTDTQRPWLLYYVRIDEFYRLQGDAGIHLAEQAMTGAWRFLRRHLGSEIPLGRVRDNAFLFVTSTHTPSDARRMAEDLCRALENETFALVDQRLNLHFSIGISSIDSDHESPTSWVDRCLKAVQALDAEGGTTVSTPVRLFEDLYPTSLAGLNEESNIKQFVRQMLEKRMLGLAFQPIVALKEQEHEDYEVTTRQTIAELPAGIPQDLFKRAFRTNVAGDLDRWAILEAFRVLQSRLQEHPRTRLFVKISATSLRDPAFPNWLKMSFQAARLEPRSLAFQIEEKDASLSVSATRALAEQLRALGVALGLTHYGLTNPPGRIFADVQFAFAKPDQSCVLRATTTTEGVEQLSSCIHAAKQAGVQVIVPFVEDASIIPLLWKLGVDHVQGYYIQSPGDTMNYDFSSSE
ncbi:MAG TPA: EAL domain-containing protein [Porticoccaceae bacterium]|nr:EAL domain-containing protein [Porticoccaceae bacterium]